jgi:hypothetical protein
MGSGDGQRVGIGVPRLGVHARKHGKQRNEREQIDAVVFDDAANTTSLAVAKIAAPDLVLSSPFVDRAFSISFKERCRPR